MSERGHFTTRQRDMLLAPVQSHRVQNLDGISHLAAWDVVAHLNRVFGFEGWDKEILTIEPVYEHVGQREVDNWEHGRKNGKKTVPACSVGYRCTMRLTVRNPGGEIVRVVEDVAMGTATNQRDMGDAHDLALKSAVSYALKRCAKDLGDQFGLSLYNRGQETACVQRVFPYESDAHDGDHHVEVNVEADGISEGDDSFGDKRGDRSEPAAQPAPEAESVEGEHNPAADVESHPEDNVPPVREPAPRREPKPKPEATPPPEPEPEPEVDKATEEALLAEIGNAASVDAVKDIWRGVQAKGELDAMVLDLKTEKQVTLRELMVRRVSEIETEGAA